MKSAIDVYEIGVTEIKLRKLCDQRNIDIYKRKVQRYILRHGNINTNSVFHQFSGVDHMRISIIIIIMSIEYTKIKIVHYFGKKI
jgi:hypothetical protein